MSTLRVDAIRHNSATSDAITTHSDGTASAKIIDVGGGQLSHRNIVVNGAMTVAQRGVSGTTSGYASVDRFETTYSGTDEAPTQSQHTLTSSDTGPYAEGFRYSYHVTNGNQTSGAGASDYVRLRYKAEAQDMALCGWNYTSASSFITLSFWVKASVTQTYYVQMRTSDGTNKSYYFPMNLSANTWTKVTHLIPGHADISFDNDTNEGIYIAWYPYRGTNNTGSGQDANQWNDWNGSTITPDQTTTWYTTNDATFEITGVQLEVGDTATSFEHRSYGEELSRCSRYYQKIAEGNSKAISVCFHYNTQYSDWVLQYPMGPMRASPSIDMVQGSDYYYLHGGSNNVYLDGAFIIEHGQVTQANVYFDPDGGLTAGGTGYLKTNNNSAYLAISAEI